MDATPFGHYQLLELMGRGGMGQVYRAFDTLTDRIVALKLLPTHLAEDTVFQQRFRRESHAAAGMNDPHVVPIHGFGEIDGRLYLDMRLIDGNDLGTLLAEDDQKPLKPALAVTIIEQVAAALDAAHALGLMHRDVKPSNIFVTKQRLRLSDRLRDRAHRQPDRPDHGGKHARHHGLHGARAVQGRRRSTRVRTSTR